MNTHGTHITKAKKHVHIEVDDEMAKKRIDRMTTALSSWRGMMRVYMKMNEEELVKTIEQERAGQNRADMVRRLVNRLGQLRKEQTQKDGT